MIMSFIHRFLCKLFLSCAEFLQTFTIVWFLKDLLVAIYWLIIWLHIYWDDYRRNWCIWFIFIKQGKIILKLATLSATTWTDWCHANSVLPRGRLITNHMRFFRISARQTFTGEVTLLQSISSYLRVLR